MRVWPGAGVPLVLLHGLLDSGEGWNELARASSRPCIAFDLPGFGGSDLVARPRISSYAGDILAALSALGVRRCHLVGHSIGGAIATAIAERSPHEVASLVLLAPAGFGRIRLAEAVSIPGIRTVVAHTLPLALANPLVLTAAYMTVVTRGQVPDAETLQRVVARAFDSVPGARDGTRAVVAAGLADDGYHRRRVAYHGPVTVVWGDRDRLVPLSHADAVRRALPQARIESWPNMGHHPQRERPGPLSALVSESCPDSNTPAEQVRLAA